MPGKLRIVPNTELPTILTVARTCRRPSCARELPRPSGRSRPPVFCTAACRRLFAREQGAVRAQLLEAQRVAEQYGLSTGRGSKQMSDAGARRLAETVLGLIGEEIDRVQSEFDDGANLAGQAVLRRVRVARREAEIVLKEAGVSRRS